MRGANPSPIASPTSDGTRKKTRDRDNSKWPGLGMRMRMRMRQRLCAVFKNVSPPSRDRLAINLRGMVTCTPFGL